MLSFFPEGQEKQLRIKNREMQLNTAPDNGEVYKLIAHATNEVIWDWDLLNDHFWWSDNFYSYLGYNNDSRARLPISWRAGIHSEDRERVSVELGGFMQEKRSFWSTEYRFLKANFTILNIYNRGKIFYNAEGKAIRLVGSMIDISDRKKAEQDLVDRNGQLRNLSAYLQTQREEEKRSVAYEMHEELAQELAGINVEISSLIHLVPAADKVLGQRLDVLSNQLKKSINKVQRISFELYPGILKDIGLTEALECYCQKFADENATSVFFSREQEPGVSTEAGIAIYRAFQQALANALEHGAGEIFCTLRVEKEHLLLTVCDDGKNFLKAEELKSSIEIQAMKEKLALFNAKLTIDIDWKEGSCLTISLAATS